ncbi:ganglioside-induced differentiation-associated protein 1 [Neodiprion pinetum]|uniref:Ganglioside-induced differentiation-associated protein 1 n=1 Tax=Neodiprion lecontei TaxID=441921 RepID=A0A6J0CCP0_NEOLC|nr:ganglioside-induced differentiation-associated protein 1 [Neodiprion lecontei]XP_015524463.1 ganglioside-induced differentiation-associated protein 1 [Neodiprion lecontei]XP_046418899.1 ganglioside-induced differentiation-associated protein 1 [Neodiprion fabricii]XP_046418900.1 ganglioside-induced differentiation-associated protein 1 [Neodiprion fabricii]XP_046474877.1 ganglioside-induced differentiation-associated protein 1 [Neodiprion pinetum]XP_046474878.1 ganglioside-induced differentia
MVAATDDSSGTTASSPEAKVQLTLYYHRYSFYSQKVLLALYEKKLDFKLREVDITRGEQYGAWFLGLNPRGEVPVLQDGDKIIPESVRIIDYLEDHFTGDNVPSLVPSEASSKQKILELRKVLDQLPGNVLTVGSFHHKKFVDKPKLPFIGPVRWLLSRAEETSAETLRINAEKIPAAREVLLRKAAAQEKTHEIVQDNDKFNDALAQVETALEKVEEALKPGPWLGGEQFTVADVSLAVLLERMSGLGLDGRLWGTRTDIKNYYDRLQQRESFKAAVPRGWLPLLSLAQWQTPATVTAVCSAVIAGFLWFKKRH